jgi:FkbM family methyltransferase
VGILEKGDRVLEVGAGIGFLSILAAKIVWSENVFCYEANPQLIKTIQRNFELNGYYPILKNCIISESVGFRQFYIENDFWSSSTYKRSHNAKEKDIQTEEINDVLNRYRPNTIIMDIEGGEKDLIPIINFNNIKNYR